MLHHHLLRIHRILIRKDLDKIHARWQVFHVEHFLYPRGRVHRRLPDASRYIIAGVEAVVAGSDRDT
jgi:hypothetical protein